MLFFIMCLSIFQMYSQRSFLIVRHTNDPWYDMLVGLFVQTEQIQTVANAYLNLRS